MQQVDQGSCMFLKGFLSW